MYSNSGSLDFSLRLVCSHGRVNIQQGWLKTALCFCPHQIYLLYMKVSSTESTSCTSPVQDLTSMSWFWFHQNLPQIWISSGASVIPDNIPFCCCSWGSWPWTKETCSQVEQYSLHLPWKTDGNVSVRVIKLMSLNTCPFNITNVGHHMIFCLDKYLQGIVKNEWICHAIWWGAQWPLWNLFLREDAKSAKSIHMPCYLWNYVVFLHVLCSMTGQDSSEQFAEGIYDILEMLQKLFQAV